MSAAPDRDAMAAWFAEHAFLGDIATWAPEDFADALLAGPLSAPPAAPAGDEGEAVERLRAFAAEAKPGLLYEALADTYGGGAAADIKANVGALIADLRTLLAALSRERERAERAFAAAMFGVEEGEGAGWQWAVRVDFADGSDHFFMPYESEELARPSATDSPRNDAIFTLVRQAVGPWRDAPPGGTDG